MSDERLTLGNQAPFVWTRDHFAVWFRLDENWRHWPKPYERFFERLGCRRYGAGPKPWAPGRYRTALWHPGGHGRFSGLADIGKGAYHAERYTGVRKRPEDYLKTHGQPGEYERVMERDHRKRSWRFSA